MDHREPITIESRAHRAPPPWWARLLGAAIAFGALALLGFEWFLVAAVPLTIFFFWWHKRTFGHWPD